MPQKSLLLLFILSIVFPTLSVFAETNEDSIAALLTATVQTTSEEDTTPIRNARIIVINSFGEIIGTELTNSEGKAKIPVTVLKNPKFPMINMGEVTVIAVANGYNEHINFSVPINEFNDNTGSVSFPLWTIDPNKRNEPHFLNGSFHRFTVFEMLDYYAEKIGLRRQEITVDIGTEAPWSSELKID